ncbi:MAG: zf-HC2 domain-containing protein [Pseudonocardiales bacterium]
MSTPWHADSTALSTYAAGRADPVTAASIEAHLTSCGSCRTSLGSAVDPARVHAIFAEVTERLDAPRAGFIEHTLIWMGVRSDAARLLTVTPLIRGSWLLSVLAVAAFAVIAADASPAGTLAFLVLAPLAPVAGVAAAFGRGGDPCYEVAVAAPYSALRLLMIRAIAVLVTTALGVLAASLLLPGDATVTLAWLLPSLALTGLTLAASERVDPVLAAGTVTASWIIAVVSVRTEYDVHSMFGSTGQGVFLALTLVSAVEIWRSRDRVNSLRRLI